MSSTTITGLTLAAYIDALGVRPGEKLGILRIRKSDGRRQTGVAARAAVAGTLDAMRREMTGDCDEYLGPNPTGAAVGRNNGRRGGKDEIARVAAIYADIDVKPGACDDINQALDILNAISEAIGEYPTVLIYSGGGLQPVWVLEDCPREVGLVLLARFGRLVQRRGEKRGIKLDSVFDAARVLRIPGTVNHKYDHKPSATAQHGQGGPIDPATLAERLDEMNIPEYPEDSKPRGDVVMPEVDWKFALDTCGYAASLIKQHWPTDPAPERHPKLLCWLVRLECMRRKGCLTQRDYDRAQRDLETRFLHLLATQEPTRKPHPATEYRPGEVDALRIEAIDRTSRKTDAEVDRELGNHSHLTDTRPPGADPAGGESAATTTGSSTTTGSGSGGLAGKLLTRGALAELPTPTPLIDNVLDMGTVALLYGKWGTGKSFIALDWAASVATGRHWQNRPTERRRVLYIAAEGAFGLQARVTAWETGWQRTIADGDLSILPCAVNLTDPGEVAELAALVAVGGYGLVVIDTLARCMVGADENSAKDCGQVVDALTRLREATPGGLGVVLAVHHTGKDGKTFRGSSVFEAGADTVYLVTEDGGVITLDRDKRKDGPRDDEHTLRLGSIAESCVVNAYRDGPQLMPERAEQLLTVFRTHFAHTGASRAELREVAGMQKTTFYRALDDALDSGQLANISTQARPFYELGK